MQVILQQDVEGLGTTGDIVRVANGFARNHLLPRGLAMRADLENVRQLEHLKRVTAEKRAVALAAAEALAAQINETAVSIRRDAGEGDKLFGSVTNRDIAAALAEEGIELDKKAIQIAEPIREIGAFTLPIRVAAGVEAELKVFVIRE